METPEQPPEDLGEETEQGGYDESEPSGDAEQRTEEPEHEPDQESSSQTGAEQGRGF